MEGTSDVDAIVVAAGTSERFGLLTPKLLVEVDGRPLLAHAVGAIAAHPGVERIVVMHPEAYAAPFVAAIRPFLPDDVAYAVGGPTRQATVRIGLDHVGTSRVLVHDGARPLVDAALIDRVMEPDAAAVVPTWEIPFSVAVGQSRMEEEVDRSRLRNIQVPQVFDTAILRQAHERAAAAGESVTEDGVLVFRLGHEVVFVPGLLLPGAVRTTTRSGILKSMLMTSRFNTPCSRSTRPSGSLGR